MAGKCEATVCLWFQARGAKDSTSMCWDLDAQWTNLLIKNAPISIDTKFDVYWDYENEADEKSAVLVLDKINDDCWTQCKVISGYEAKIACE
ncbi:hypothetical protein MNEG_9401 [Monoraphidium neglectum]|uniref:Uncharacterized protein n=1 Tax=Monoraphidium neglectum TaxID=145388 RepID=A0A0D2MW79_9CHLO|nr:hypothetical protein MNEG_9401 [Monoraphidium neglectum]KIY98560.1 hypothetical protein MNEG_9401 [Monoraphidium neglectum]|eukprot:XP_013897580.1 hypothetical protein MNEG_9401 [Monoraphidium neglectum]